MTTSSEKMRVLHVWNTGGVASLIARYMDREGLGTESRVITRKAADPVGLTDYGTAYDDGATRFFIRALSMSRHADIVHVHALDRFVPWVKRLYPSKPVVLYYLGTDIRGRWRAKEARWRRADFIGYTTSDLSEGAPPVAEQVFCPIDTEFFRPGAAPPRPNSAVSIGYGMDSETESLAGKMSLDLTLMKRGSVPYAQMPSLLSKYEYYIDLRRTPDRTTAVECLGKAALEALACGCKAVDWSGKVHVRLPEEDRPEKVAAKWAEIYRRLLSEKRR
jgi:hypothetical protein